MTGGLRGLWLGGAAALMLAVSACGFTPLHGEAATAGRKLAPTDPQRPPLKGISV